jgi:gluconate kinase
MKVGMLNSQLLALERPQDIESHDTVVVDLVDEFGNAKSLGRVVDESVLGLETLGR